MIRPGEGLSQTITRQLNILQSAYKIDSTREGLPALPTPWQTLSLGGDNYKLIAVNRELGIVAKRYIKKEYAAILDISYDLLKPAAEKIQLPLLFPIGLHEDMQVFPFIQGTEGQKDHAAMRGLKEATLGIKLPLELANFLSTIAKVGGGVVFYDAFEDSVANLYKKTGIMFD